MEGLVEAALREDHVINVTMGGNNDGHRRTNAAAMHVVSSPSGGRLGTNTPQADEIMSPPSEMSSEIPDWTSTHTMIGTMARSRSSMLVAHPSLASAWCSMWSASDWRSRRSHAQLSSSLEDCHPSTRMSTSLSKVAKASTKKEP